MTCLGFHIFLSGTAKCSARECKEREDQLINLAREVNHRIVTLTPIINDDASPSASTITAPTTATSAAASPTTTQINASYAV